jgi:hypothetical protein
LAFDQRTILVLFALVFGMSATYGVLRFLEPGQVPPLSGLTLMSVERTPTDRPEDKLFDTEAELGWQVIVIHDSQQPVGSYDTIDRAHRRTGKNGCGYHFVVGNGTDTQDGRIEVGYRWKYQQVGDFFVGPEAEAFNRRFRTIGICVVGDLDAAPMTPAQQRELVWLVRQLSERYGIAADRVFVDAGSDGDGSATHFPYATFRDQIAQTAVTPLAQAY